MLLHPIRSVKRLIGKDHRCITIHLQKQLPNTGGAAMNAMMKQEVAVNNVGNIKQPNQPM
jgi:hypothetical protein